MSWFGPVRRSGLASPSPLYDYRARPFDAFEKYRRQNESPVKPVYL